MSRNHRLIKLLLVALIAMAAMLAPVAQARADHVRWFESAREGVRTVTFKLTRIETKKIVSAAVVTGKARRKVSVRSVRRGVRRGVVRIRRRAAGSRRAVAFHRLVGSRHARAAKRTKLRLVVDTTPPETRLTSYPAGFSGPDTSFGFAASESGARFQCRVDDAAWAACTSPSALAGLPDGSHTFAVRAVDAAGNIDATPSVHTWTVTAPSTAPETDPAPTTSTTPTTVEGSAQRPAGSAPLSDAEAAARVKRSSWEPRPENATANHRVPSTAEVEAYRAARGSGWCNGADLAVTGNFTGTTDEILQWGAHKWGIDADLLRAVSTQESWWKQSALGDNGTSFGLTQVKNIHHGTHPLSAQSTAFNVDYYGAILRYYFDGCATWLNDVERGQQYAAGDIWGSVGAWYAGRWHTSDAEDYIAKVKQHLAARTWAGSSF